jgi:hypothetical protein
MGQLKIKITNADKFSIGMLKMRIPGKLLLVYLEIPVPQFEKHCSS